MRIELELPRVPDLGAVVTAGLLLLAMTAAATPLEAGHPALIVIYDGIGTTARARVSGRVLEDKGLPPPSPGESSLQKLRRSFHELESDELRGVTVSLTITGRAHVVKADDEGIFRLDLPGPLPVGKHPVDAALVPASPSRVEKGLLHVFPAKPGTAVVSDIDDTILKTGVQKKLRMIGRTLLSNAHDLEAFAGGPALYRVWARRGYPIVFVSGSPINLYSRLVRFFELAGLPRAPVLLKNLGFERGADSLTEQVAYKLRRIKEVRELLPGYRLVLVGDSGEKDPEVYAQVAASCPGQVDRILIHRVTEDDPGAPRYKDMIVFGEFRDLADTLAREKRLTARECRSLEN